MDCIAKFFLNDLFNIKDILRFALYEWKKSYKITIYLDDLTKVKLDSINMLFIPDKYRLNNLDFNSKIDYAFYFKGDEKEALGYISCICYAMHNKIFPSSTCLSENDKKLKPKLEILQRDDDTLTAVLTIINNNSIFIISSVVENL